MYKAPGQLASENAGRAPRRTSATVAALMIGVALVSASAVFAASLRNTFEKAMDRGVTADWVVTAGGFALLPDVVSETLAEVPELSAVSGVRSASVLIDGDEKLFGAADPVALEQLINVGLESGDWEGLQEGGIFVHKDPAGRPRPGGRLDRRGDVPERRGARAPGRRHLQRRLPRRQLADVLDGGRRDRLRRTERLLRRPEDGRRRERGRRRQAIEDALVEYPQAKIETADQFKDSQAEQIDQLLVIITVLLAFAIIIAVLGISITLGLAVFERTREIGLMRAVGMTKRQTRRMVRWEAIIVSTFGAVVGIVLGTLIGIVLSLAVPDTIIDGISFSRADDHRHPHRRRPRRVHRRPLPLVKASRMDVLEAIATE